MLIAIQARVAAHRCDVLLYAGAALSDWQALAGTHDLYAQHRI